MLVSLAVASVASVAGFAATTTTPVPQWFDTNKNGRPATPMVPIDYRSPDIIYRGDLPQSAIIKGAKEYDSCASTWEADYKNLLGESYESEIRRVAQLSSATEYAVRWRCEWSNDSVRWLENVAKLFGWQVERFDLDPAVESSFSWKSVGQLFAGAFATSTIQLPIASVEGRAVLRIDEASGLCVEHRETVDLLSLARSGRLRNRKVATNLAEWMDIRRPLEVDPDEWASEVSATVLAGVPGAGPLDIEPMADSAEGALALGLFALVAAGALATSINVLGVGTGVFGYSFCDEVAGGNMLDYTQCVSDVF